MRGFLEKTVRPLPSEVSQSFPHSCQSCRLNVDHKASHTPDNLRQQQGGGSCQCDSRTQGTNAAIIRPLFSPVADFSHHWCLKTLNWQQITEQGRAQQASEWLVGQPFLKSLAQFFKPVRAQLPKVINVRSNTLMQVISYKAALASGFTQPKVCRNWKINRSFILGGVGVTQFRIVINISRAQFRI